LGRQVNFLSMQEVVLEDMEDTEDTVVAGMGDMDFEVI
jgi:hypothetical protein